MQSTRCGCGETPENIAVMKRSLNFYSMRNIHTGELEQVKSWLKAIKNDCESKIEEIKRLERDRKRSENWRREMNEISKQFRDPEHMDLDLNTRAKIIQQRLGCSVDRARQIADHVHAWAVRENRRQRNEQICFKYRCGESAAHLSKVYGVSRQQVYNIIKADKDYKFIKNGR